MSPGRRRWRGWGGEEGQLEGGGRRGAKAVVRAKGRYCCQYSASLWWSQVTRPRVIGSLGGGRGGRQGEVDGEGEVVGEEEAAVSLGDG